MQESLFNEDAGFTLQFYYEKILTQESNLTIFKHTILWNTPSMPFYEERQPSQFFEASQGRHFIKHAKHAILWGTSSTPFYEARQAHKHAKHAST